MSKLPDNLQGSEKSKLPFDRPARSIFGHSHEQLRKMGPEAAREAILREINNPQIADFVINEVFPPKETDQGGIRKALSKVFGG